MRIRLHGPLFGFLANPPVARRAHQTRALWTPQPPKIEPGEKCRTRFAPSPTGDLHLGSLRTALFNYLLAKKTGGQFLVRIEDTDQARTVEFAEEGLLKDLRWAGLQYDEGPDINGPYGPYKQSERLSIYTTHVKTLLQTGKAYRCFCEHRVHQKLPKSEQKKADHGYDRTCAHIPRDESDLRAEKEPYVVRLFMDDAQKFADLVYGKTKGNLNTFGPKDGRYQDPILIKRDGWPTYHFANVVDDHLMKITHVIRGSEWIPSTPQHVALYDAFGWTPPKFAHVPLLTDPHGQKLSKRLSARSVAVMREDGILPEALINFAALLGWSPRQTSEVMTLRDMEQKFDLRITKGNTKINLEKLKYFQEAHIKLRVDSKGQALDTVVDSAAQLVQRKYGPTYPSLLNGRTLHQYVEQILLADKKNLGMMSQFIEESSYLFFSIDHLPPRVPSGRDEPVLGDENDSVHRLHPELRLDARFKDRIKRVPIDVGALGRHPYFQKLILGIDSNWAPWEIEEMTMLSDLLKATSAEDWAAQSLNAAVKSAGASIRKHREKTVNRKLTKATIDSHLTGSLKAAWNYARWGIAFGRSGMAVIDIMVILGREECLKRMDLLCDSAKQK